MKNSFAICAALIVAFSGPVAFARGGGMGSHHSSGIPVTGGAFGTSPSAPGTNSLGTALPSNGVGNGPQKGPLLGTNPPIDRDEARLNKAMSSICRGC